MSSPSFARAIRYDRWFRFESGLLWLAALAGAALTAALMFVLGMLVRLLAGEALPAAGRPLGTFVLAAEEALRPRLSDGSPSRWLLALVVMGAAGIVLWGWLRNTSLKLARALAEGVAARLRSELRRQAGLAEAAELLCRRELAAAELFTNKAETVKLGLAARWTAIPRDVLLLVVLAGMVLAAHLGVGLAAVALGCLGWLVLSAVDARV
jgi:hypothetical protein